MAKKDFKRIQRSATALFSALALLAGGAAVSAEDDIMFDTDPSGYDDSSGGSVGSITPTDDYDSAFLIEDMGEDVQYNAGVSMDTLQDAMSAGDQKTLDKIASLGALTGSTPGSASIGGGGAYRERNDEDDEEYYDLHLDEGDADEVQTEVVDERPGPLMAANAERIQGHLEALTQVDSPTGSEGELTIASYIETKLGELGYTVQEQPFHEGVLNEDGIDAPGVNILAERGANSQKNRKKDIFLVVTHYDSKRSPAEGDPFANDKSGAAALIETARIIAEVVTDTDVCFLFLSGQEDGGYGAQNFIAALNDENLSRISGMLSVERVGYDSDTPYVLKTLTGESNSLGDIVQQLGLTNDALLSRTENQDLPKDDYGTWVPVGQSSDGYIDEKTAQQIAAAQADANYGAENAISIDSSEYMEFGGASPEDAAGEDAMYLDEEETESEPVPMPSAWSYLKDSTPTLTTFGGGSYPAVSVSQYMPELDGDSYEETKALGLADTTLAAIEQLAAAETYSQENTAGADITVQPEQAYMTGAADDSVPLEDPSVPVVDASLIADTTNVIAATLAQIMDPTT